MTIFWRMFLSHLLSDFTLQLDVVNRMKRNGTPGMLVHCLTHYVVSLALTWPFLGQAWFSLGGRQFNGWWACTVMLALHYIIDHLRILSMKRLHYKDGTVSFLTDQFLHIYVLFMLCPVAIGGADGLLGEKWTGIACMFVLVSHVTTVLIYFLEKEQFGKDFPSFDEKYFLIFERLVLWSFFFVHGYWWVPFAAAWVAQIFYVKRKRIIDLSTLNVALSVLITCGLGVWTRYIYYGGL